MSSPSHSARFSTPQDSSEDPINCTVDVGDLVDDRQGHGKVVSQKILSMTRRNPSNFLPKLNAFLIEFHVFGSNFDRDSDFDIGFG